MAIDMAAVLPFLAAVAVIALIYGVLDFLSRRNTRAEDRLARFNRAAMPSMMDIEPPSSGGLDNKMKDIIDRFSGLAKPLQPQSEFEQSKLRQRLAHAGFRSEKAVSIFLGIRMAALVVAFLGLVALASIYWPKSGNILDLFKGIGGIYMAAVLAVGLYGPELALSMLVRSRQENIFLSLPDVLDLMVVCVESGLGLDAAMRKICEEMKEHAPAMVEELTIANFQLQMGRPKRDVLHDLGVRTGVDDVKSLAAILIQADRFGSSVAQALRIQSDSMRTRRKQLAEERAAKTAVKLIFPLVLFIFPGIFVVLGGPAVVKLSEAFK
jgi:tight adherence protein C